MAYADQQMSGNKLVALILVALIHVVVGYALVTGLAYEAVQKIKEELNTFDVKEEEPPPEEPPPPEPEQQQEPPPIVAPPPPIQFNRPAPQIQTQREIPPQAPPVRVALPPPEPGPALQPPPPPPPPRTPPKAATPRGNPGSWANTNDYPSRALREEREGTTRFSVQIGTDGRVTSCSVTASSGHADLDEATCKNIQRRARFNPATDGDGNPTTGTWASAVRWEIPEG